MSLTLTSKFMNFYLRIPDGQWDLSAIAAPGPHLESVSMAVAWRGNGARRTWDGNLYGAHISESTIEDSNHGPMQRVVVEQQLTAHQLTLRLNFSLGLETPIFLWRIHLINKSTHPIHLGQMEMLRVGSPRYKGHDFWTRSLRRMNRPWEHHEVGALRFQPSPGRLAFYSTGWQSWTFAGTLGEDDRLPRTRLGLLATPMYVNAGTLVPHSRGSFTSDMFGVVGDRRSRVGVLAGFLSQREAFGSLEAQLEASNPYLRLWANGDRALLMPGETFSTDWACIQFVNIDAEVPLEPYLEAVACENNARRTTPVPVGWCTWYYFFQSVTQDDVLANLHWAQLNRGEFPLEIIQVDDGFQAEVGDWLVTDEASFPGGMLQLNNRIREAGFQPGLWLAPFIAKPNAQLLRKHPDWILRNKWRLPVNAGFAFNTFSRALDITHPEYLTYLHDLIAKVVHDWGYDYLKLDFLYAGALPGIHHDPARTRAQAFHSALKVIREAAGEEVTILGCGCPLGPGIGIFDCMRIGPDVAPQWQPSVQGIQLFCKDEPMLPSTRNAIHSTISRAFLHGRWWVNDPDCLLVRDKDTNLTEAEVRSLATVISLSGGALVVSDHLPFLSEERIAWLARLLPPLPNAARAVDWFDTTYPSRLVLPLAGETGSWHLVAIFNWGECQLDFNLDLETFGVQTARAYHMVDFWRASYFQAEGSSFHLTEIPRHGVRLFAVRPVIEAPQWLGDTLHISQGLAVQTWQVSEGHLAVKINLGRSAQGRVWLALPSVPKSATIDSHPISYHQEAEGVYAIDLVMEEEARLEILWE